MSYLPFPEIPYSLVRSGDVLLLLVFGFIYELSVRLFQYACERRTSRERRMSIQLASLKYQAAKKRALGPSAFVETSKIERAILATEKKLTKLVEDRNARAIYVKSLVKKINIASNLLVLAAYWGVSMIELDGGRLSFAGVETAIIDERTDLQRAGDFWKGTIFPLSYYGMGYTIAQRGLDADARNSSVGALAVFWAARVTCGEVFQCAMIWLGR